jgi:hypothetical protein
VFYYVGIIWISNITNYVIYFLVFFPGWSSQKGSVCHHVNKRICGSIHCVISVVKEVHVTILPISISRRPAIKKSYFSFRKYHLPKLSRHKFSMFCCTWTLLEINLFKFFKDILICYRGHICLLWIFHKAARAWSFYINLLNPRW